MLTNYANYAPQKAIMLQKYAIMLLIFLGPGAFSRDSMLSGSALVLLELSEASSPESSMSFRDCGKSCARS